ncbi:hypothetical protein W97_09295 [Coniosporium apollinis CBS 100218]|uniref:Arrestin C-terminal-like domain-containing protein n=1 Tax=Coniosporium apollinis (strain CBS 100218) TaxID=1168221 RepID=R7Z7M5_CONA1|nr:uncharacterized protein W97_09295 [Coniosporium apollinis CBS 100218]EON70029.1 hypothetical protein W97_09295 [Coniosporium apollinis CBS 100218]
MTEYQILNSQSGRLTYLSGDRHDCPQTNPGLFQPRTRRPNIIRISHVAPDYPRHVSPLRKGRSVITAKLAGPSESAKRILRAFIASHTSLAPEKPSTQSRRSSSSSAGAPREAGADAMRAASRSSVGGPVSGIIHRPSLVESVRASSGQSVASRPPNRILTNTIPDEKPVASGGNITVSVALAEPMLYVHGFEQDETSERSTAMLRGSLHLRVTKSTKIKAVTLKFRGLATTLWPEGIPPRKTEHEEVDTIMSHIWPFFNAQFPTAEAGTCADHVELFPGTSTSSTASSLKSLDSFGRNGSASSASGLSSRDQKRLSLQVAQSRSFGKGDSSTNGPSVAQKGYRTFAPGDYVYNFELPLDSHLPETIDVELGSVRYELEATVERAGAFRGNLVGTKEVQLIRAPSEGSLEQIEPIAISRNWEDQLHYDIVISGKSFPLGAQIPIAFKLTPLAKVQCHRVKVFITESIEYFCNNKRVHRMEPTRKLQLFEKRAEGSSTSTFPGSTVRITSGGGIPFDQRVAAARGEEVTPTDTTNLLGNLEADPNAGPTEMEFSVQLPSCHHMRDKDKLQKLHFDTTYQNIQVHHWIKIVMRLSKPDENDPTKRRHFEISIDSPFHILSCRATQANTALPAYSAPENANDSARVPECGCPGAPMRRHSPTSYVPTLNALNGSRERSSSMDEVPSPGLTRPQQAHLGGPINQNLQRPIHMLRAPSFNPPAFEDDEPPPPMVTPPPQYDSIASPTSGLADYFSRLSDTYDDDDDGLVRTPGRVEIPLTPGARVNRSMDERRTWLPIGHYAR